MLLSGNNAGSIPVNVVVISVNVDSNAILVIEPSDHLFVFRYTFLQGSAGLTHIDKVAVTVGDPVDYTLLLFIEYPVLHSHKRLANGLNWFDDSFHLNLVDLMDLQARSIFERPFT